ncbi:16S rRNA (uracil(1498)-N(3))-methyltransferase [Siphonobacter sp. SORGH_AS_0500]|uniref:16S rRNA (uracil(1498)-N(3))-methyltransferase n=1 Tax=Siphonobacter sp. SORGH_AS_0500 TaxID=1864824 RepID=UPI000CC279FB|nr:16S rRNA (uracil(1498)-N(3))-methyltransferase [Siphonobacter sp. SORGH_AS_0500]MDR6195128.1 16S rRNA (uracil1498-N3)-methyltransferase [Siphonobacter sp. SORGH_AS_0500]PKK38352.1 16S rRNA (uracil(1498)-N(3))-methyltransferase [Siphonobacter sp. SORGH_AS_0500]
MHLFFESEIQEHLYLSEEESRHAVKVLRLGTGDIIKIVDGKGSFYEAAIVNPNPKRCSVQIRSEQREETRPYSIHLAITPTKDLDRIEWMLEKCVEVGVSRVSFILTKRTDERYWKGKSINLERLQKIAVSALKQSLNLTLPAVEGLVPWKDFLNQVRLGSQKFIAHLEDDDRKLLKTEIIPGKDYVILIGPEGDFTASEIEEAKRAGFLSVSLGNSRLRTETAGLIAVHTLDLMNQ